MDPGDQVGPALPEGSQGGLTGLAVISGLFGSALPLHSEETEAQRV